MAAPQQESNYKDGEDIGEEASKNVESVSPRTYIKPRVVNMESLQRRQRKNELARARSAAKRKSMEAIEKKDPAERTEDEQRLLDTFNKQRYRKNNRSRERAREQKKQIEKILANPAKKRTKLEKQYMELHMNRQQRKNEGDRMRRQRLKMLGLNGRKKSEKPGIPARGPLPVQYAAKLNPSEMGAMVHQPAHGGYYPPPPQNGGEGGMSPHMSYPPYGGYEHAYGNGGGGNDGGDAWNGGPMNAPTNETV